MRPDAILFLVTQPYLSAKRLRALSAGLAGATDLPSRVARMEGVGPGATAALDALAEDGARAILVVPVGLPFSDSLAAWLPGALGHWMAERAPLGVALALASDQVGAAPVHAALVADALEKAEGAAPVTPDMARLDNPGWQDPPPFHHHLLVCAGPRCTFRDGGSLKAALDAELQRAKLAGRCLVTLTGCLFPCNQGPLVAHYPAGDWYRLSTRGDVRRFVEVALARGLTVADLLVHKVQSSNAYS